MNIELQTKPDLEQALHRVEAWFNHETLDRPPVRFTTTNAQYREPEFARGRSWPDWKTRWFDAEFQVDAFLASLPGRTFHGETFPVFAPNLGPNVYAAFHGAELEFGPVTSWVKHCIHEPADLANLRFDAGNEYFRGIEELTRVALQKCAGQFLVGYTDLHSSLDCVADWRDPQQLCLDLLDRPEFIHDMLRLADEHFLAVYDHFDAVLKAHGQLSVNWMGIPSRGTLHVPSCDFTALTSHAAFREFYLPSCLREVKHTTHNIFHVDGKGLLKHLDCLLEIPEIQACQWVQGVGDDAPILQWVPVIRKIQAAGKDVVVDLQLSELEPFISALNPDGLYLCLTADEQLQPDILKRLERWRRNR